MRWLFSLLLIALTTPALAQGDDAAELVVGVYAPDVLFASALARTGFAQQVASQLSAKTGRTFVGRGFATEGDFNQQVKAGRVQFAVISAQVHVRRGGAALAQGQAGGKPARSMVLVTRDANAIGQMQGGTIAGIGKADRGFAMNFLLQGQVPPKWFKFKSARDVQAALGLVKLGRAQAAFTFSGSTAGLTPAFTSRPAPLPVFVQTDKSLPADLVKQVAGGVRGVSVQSSVVTGFGAVDTALLSQVRSASNRALQAPGTAPILAPARAALPPVPEFVDRSRPPAVVSPAAVDLSAPPAPMDAF